MILRAARRWASRGPRPAAVNRLDHVALGVRSLAVSKEWYQSVLGFEPFMADDPNFADDDLAMVKAGDAIFALLRIPEGERALRGSREQKGHAALSVTPAEIRRLYHDLPKLLEQHRVCSQQRLDIDVQDYGAQLSLFFYDPDNNELEVSAWVAKDDAVRFESPKE
eukprot:TRINITY_DN13138_c0_g1_i1.p2 TRINITY_DN13138_c0_g1~~TRINITY_DN13138_c0_g1_i1.p2  ORF type:complete len:166 (+),score=61.36 TRINITY_DN13138_c0_g1_i1:48-545(+)